MPFSRYATSLSTEGRHLPIPRGASDSNGALWTVVGFIVIVAHVAVIIPVFFYLAYTVSRVFPVLAIVERRPSYELVSLQENSDIDQHPSSLSIEEADAPAPAYTTSSLRDLHQLVKRTDRLWLRQRGFAALAVYHVANRLIAEGLGTIPFVPSSVWHIIAALLTVQLNTVWVHVIITPPKATPFWKRILGFGVVFKATAPATVLYCVATELAYLGPWYALQLINVPIVTPGAAKVQIPNSLWKAVVTLGIYLAIQAFVCAPTLVILTRIQASLLPENEETIVPVDRTFGEEKGGMDPGLSIVQAWKSFNGSWARFYKLSIKIFALILGVEAAVCAIIGLEFLILWAVMALHGH